MGYFIFVIAVVILLWYIAQESKRKDIKLKKMNNNEIRRKYEDRIVKNEANRRNNEIGKIYSTEFAEQDYLDDNFKNKTHDDIEQLNFMLPKDINTVGKLQATQHNEMDRIDDERDDHYYRKSIQNPEKRMDAVEQVLKEAYKDEKRADQDLGGSIDHDI
ncbi:MAG: hypothetical protein K0Q49_335 [Haloplasmataceae bacterium]|jgi:hypothetical protein|nr:hypothetical protein [Haloplasmataceae bacterium]